MTTSHVPLPSPLRRRILVLLALALVPTAATPAVGQSIISVAPRLGIDGGLPGTPVIGGLDVTWYEPPLPWVAIRSRVDVGITTTDLEEEAGEPHDFRAFTAETEIVLGPTHAGETELAGTVNPVVFGGFGIRSGRDTTYDGTLTPIATYGGEVRYWLSDLIRAGAELRLRTPLFGDGKLAPDFDGGLSFTLSLALHFGRSNDHAAAAPARTQQVRAESRPTGPTRAERAETDEAEVAYGVLTPDPEEPDPVELRYVPRTDLTDRARESWTTPEDRTVAETLEAAEELLGTPYVWGGAAPEPGFDCSGFIQYVYEDAGGIALPRPSRRMALAGMQLPPVVDSLRPGDLMFFAEDGDRISHVAIYVGDNEILHSSSSGVGVAYDKLGTYRGSWYLQHFVGGARVVGVPIRALRSRPIPLTPETWDPVSDGAPPPGAGPGGS